MNSVKTRVLKRKRHLRFFPFGRTCDPVKRALQTLDYDFSHFQLDHFTTHIAKQRNRPLHIVQIPLASTLFGVWIPAEIADYIFVNATLPLMHQTHIVLHEIAHMLLGHALRRINDVLPLELIAQLGDGEIRGRLRVAPKGRQVSDNEEDESERFVYAIQRRLMRANRLTALTSESSSIPRLRPITDVMGYTRS